MADSIENLGGAWNEIIKVLDPSFYELDNDINTNSNFWGAVDMVISKCSKKLITSWFLEKFKKTLRNDIVPVFWAYFVEDAFQYMTMFQKFITAVTYLYEAMKKWSKPVQLVEKILALSSSEEETKGKPFLDTFRLTYKSALLSKMPTNFENFVLEFYTCSLMAYLKRHDDGKDKEDDGLICRGCHKDAIFCECHIILHSFYYANEKLSELQLLEGLVGESLTTVTHQHIEHHINLTCKGNFEMMYLSSLEEWLENVLVSWLKIIFKQAHDENTKDAIENCKARLVHYLYDTYATSRMEEMFNIIIEFPDSQPAIEDLRNCLEKTNLRTKLIQLLKTTLETRLLHPGVNTTDILSAYTSTVKALWVLDPTGVLLELVCQPVHKYLRTRHDTVRCIVSSLTDDSSIELADEFNKGEPLVLDESYHSDDDDHWENWKPDPIDANPEKILKNKRTSDIISMLVNIYGSKDLFVKEYRSLLAERVVTHFKYDIHKELRYLELLKLRFGETHLHVCEVMLKDVVDSKRINMHIHSQESSTEPNQSNVPIDSLILSAQFWPPLREERLELHPKVKEALELYTKSFETLKGNRTLVWKNHLGYVELEVELKDRTLNVKVSPIHATIILYFEEKAQWGLEELGTVMQMPASVLKRKLCFWQSRRIIKEETPNNYVLVEDQNGRGHDVVMVDDDEEAESAMASSHEQREEELQVYWSYIVGMLTNLEALPLERIHNTLKMFAVQSPTAIECSLHELKCFLERKVKEHKLIYSTGTYKLPKAAT